jgi:stress-induced morphogen
MQMDTNMVENIIRGRFPDAGVRVDDVRGDGLFYAVFVVSAAFEGKSLLEQHRMVYDVLVPAMGDDIESALQLTTRASQ